MRDLFEWLGAHESWLAWLGGLSVVAFVASLLATPWLLARIPADYFVRPRTLLPWRGLRPELRWFGFVLKNVVGGVLFVAGVAMLFLPGQGLLTMAVGLMLMSFPGKLRIERAFVRHARVLRVIDWFRQRANVPPLQVPERE